MKSEQFDEIVENRLAKCVKVLCNKANEYATGGDRLHNFKRAGTMLDITPEKALEGMLVKHLVSVQDLINVPEKATLGLIDEKIGDVLNYFLLLESLLVERLGASVHRVVPATEFKIGEAE